MHNKASYKVKERFYYCILDANAHICISTMQYFREDMAQAKKSYEDKFGSKVVILLCRSTTMSECRFDQGVKSAKSGDKAAKAGGGFKEEVYLDAADAKTATPATGEAKSGAKVGGVWRHPYVSTFEFFLLS